MIKSDNPTLNINHISKKRGRKTILKDISLSANPGDCIAIVGRNGCGKSTLLSILAGIMKPDDGSIRYSDFNCSIDVSLVHKIPQKQLHNNNFFNDKVGYVPQTNPLIEELSVKDNLSLWGCNNKHNIDNVINTYELSSFLYKPISKLSGGMKRRVSIACALLNNPSILLLDEPTTALDLYYKELIHNNLSSYIKSNRIIIMSTHDESEISFCNKCFLMNDGILTLITQEELKNNELKKRLLENTNGGDYGK